MNIRQLLTAAVFSSGAVTALLLVTGSAQAAPGVCNVPTQAYPSIQSAVSDPVCNTVKVAAGSYNESVTIGRSLTLKGAQFGNDARNRSGAESIINKLDDNTPNITINANNVTVDGFTLNGPASGGTAALVMQNGNSDEMIRNNIINNPGRAASITTSNTTFNQNLVHNSLTSSDGFQGNTIPVTNNVVKNNTFDGTINPGPGGYNTDINFIEGSGNEKITGNKSTDDGTLVALFKTDGATVADNTVTGQHGSSAIYIGGGDSNITVRNNSVTSAGSGVNVANDFGIGTNSTVKIVKNTLTDNTNGIKVGATAVAADHAVAADRNLITGSTDHGFNNSSSFNQEATCNWWGAANGPGGVGPGSGDQVTTEAAFAPWLSQAVIKSDCSHTAGGDLRMSSPSQRIIFNVYNRRNITKPQGNVQYWNFDYPGGTLAYTASITCSYVDVQTGEARFMFQIPEGHPGLSGLYVVAYVKSVPDGTDLYGHAATSDQATAIQWCENGVGFSPTMYPVTKGNVHIKE